MMNQIFSSGADTGPMSPMYYQRAIMRSSPPEFTVESLSPIKLRHNWMYVIKVCPIIRYRQDSGSRPISPQSSHSEYEIWRQWEDCIDFQETLEITFSRLSRQRVRFLRRAATGKKKEEAGPYASTNHAASFESLPEGPDPRDIPINVHDLIPPLSRKGTLFRASRNLVEQRGREFTAMIQALFDSSFDAPVLLQELRNASPVRDFFGFWRRDKEFQKQAGKQGGKDIKSLFHPNKSMSSLLSPTFSNQVSSPMPMTPPSTPGRNMSTRPVIQGTADLGNSRTDVSFQLPVSAPANTPRFLPKLPLASRSSASIQQRYKPSGDMPESLIMFTDDLLLEDNCITSPEPPRTLHNLGRTSAPSSIPLRRVNSTAEHLVRSPNLGMPDSIPEEELPRPLPRTRRVSHAIPEHRNARIFAVPDTILHQTEETVPNARSKPAYTCVPSPKMDPDIPIADLISAFPLPASSHPASSSGPFSLSVARFSNASSISSFVQSVSKRFSRNSRQSFESDASLELDLPFTNSSIVLHTPLSEASECDVPVSVSSWQDTSTISNRTDSVGARAPIAYTRRRSFSLDSCSSIPTIGPQAPSYLEENVLEGGENQLDTYPDDLLDPPEFLGTWKKYRPPFPSHRISVGSTSSTDSSSRDYHRPWHPSDESFAVKAFFLDSVVVFRANRNISLKTLRKKIRDRFSLHESMPLGEDFVLTHLPPRAPVVRAGVIVRSNSSTSSTKDLSKLWLLETDLHWQTVKATCRDKVTLRILDADLTF